MIEHSPSTAAADSNDLLRSAAAATRLPPRRDHANPVASLSGATEQGLALTAPQRRDQQRRADRVRRGPGQRRDFEFQRARRTGLRQGPGPDAAGRHRGVRGLAGPRVRPQSGWPLPDGVQPDQQRCCGVRGQREYEAMAGRRRGATATAASRAVALDALVTVNGPGGAFTYVADLADASDPVASRNFRSRARCRRRSPTSRPSRTSAASASTPKATTTPSRLRRRGRRRSTRRPASTTPPTRSISALRTI